MNWYLLKFVPLSNMSICLAIIRDQIMQINLIKHLQSATIKSFMSLFPDQGLYFVTLQAKDGTTRANVLPLI